jgi:hypothetical protein
MNMPLTRRSFLREVGTGTLVAAVGLDLASELGIAAQAEEVSAARLTFGELEPLVRLMQTGESARGDVRVLW